MIDSLCITMHDRILYASLILAKSNKVISTVDVFP